MVQHLTTAEFQEEIFDYTKEREWKYRGNLPAVIDFWAPWCGPCMMLGPVVDALSEEYAGVVEFYKINTDEETDLAAAFGIQSIPSLLFIPEEGQPKFAAGALPKGVLKDIIERELGVKKGTVQAQVSPR